MSDFDAFDGIEDVDTGNVRNPYLKPGLYRLIVEEVSFFPSSKTNSREKFTCVEATIQHTTNGDFFPGQRVTWMQKMSLDSAVSNVKKFALALNPEATDRDITKEVIKQLCGPQQPARGIIVDADAYEITTKKTGSPFTVVNWRAATGEWSHQLSESA